MTLLDTRVTTIGSLRNLTNDWIGKMDLYSAICKTIEQGLDIRFRMVDGFFQVRVSDYRGEKVYHVEEMILKKEHTQHLIRQLTENIKKHKP